jgi:predicted nucleic acid-binding protein
LRLYLDAAPVIYLVQDVEPYASRTRAILNADDATLVASDLTRLECCVKPMHNNDTQLLQDFADFFQAPVKLHEIRREVMLRATQIRADYGFKTPDAIHIAVALTTGCDVFLRNDHRLDRCHEIGILTLDL